jgi:hypothetical protein
MPSPDLLVRLLGTSSPERSERERERERERETGGAGWGCCILLYNLRTPFVSRRSQTRYGRKLEGFANSHRCRRVQPPARIRLKGLDSLEARLEARGRRRSSSSEQMKERCNRYVDSERDRATRASPGGEVANDSVDRRSGNIRDFPVSMFELVPSILPMPLAPGDSEGRGPEARRTAQRTRKTLMHLYIKYENRHSRCWVVAVGTVSTNSQLQQQPASAKRPCSLLAARLVMIRVAVGIPPTIFSPAAAVN